MANQTKDDIGIAAQDRAIPEEMYRKSVTLAGTGTENVDLGFDVKTCVIVCSDPVYFNVSYKDNVSAGAPETPGDLVTANTDRRVLLHPGNGGSFIVAQNAEFNKIYVKGVASSTDTIQIYPGEGIKTPT
jgi:ABC-type thiamine transport system substrate-binding protein